MSKEEFAERREAERLREQQRAAARVAKRQSSDNEWTHYGE